MAKKQIQGNYTIIAEFTGAFSTAPNIENNNRNKSKSATVSVPLNFLCTSISGASNYAYLIKQNKTVIKRGRVITGGAEGLRTAVNSPIAAEVGIIDFGGGAGTLNNQSVVLNFPKFNEWTNFDVVFEPYKRTNDQNDDVELNIAYPVTDIHYDDYNIQSAYENEYISLFIELEIDTAGILINGEVV